jgi:pyruvate carboxylase subunit B
MMATTFTLRLDGTAYEVERKGRAVLINGKRFEPEVSGDTVTIGDATHRVEIDDTRAFVDGIVYRLETEGLKRERAAPLTSLTPTPDGGDGAVTAIMPGLIIKVLASVGDEVATGDVLLILEAMKMESEVCAPRAGVIKEVMVKDGDNVTQNQAMMTIE